MSIFIICIYVSVLIYSNRGHTQKNGAVLIVNTIKTAPIFCVLPVFIYVNFLCGATAQLGPTPPHN
jgi:hypothetical protein